MQASERACVSFLLACEQADLLMMKVLIG